MGTSKKQQTAATGLGRPSAILPDLISPHGPATEFLAEHLATQLGPILQLDVTMLPCSSQGDMKVNSRSSLTSRQFAWPSFLWAGRCTCNDPAQWEGQILKGSIEKSHSAGLDCLLLGYQWRRNHLVSFKHCISVLGSLCYSSLVWTLRYHKRSGIWVHF